MRLLASKSRSSSARAALSAITFAWIALSHAAAAAAEANGAAVPEPERAAPSTASPAGAAARSGATAPEQTASTERPNASPETVRAETIAVEDERLRAAEIYQDTPVETEVLERERLDALPATDAIQALEAIPGIRITSQVQGQRGAVRIDGLPPEFTEILVDGQRYAGENERAIDLGDMLFANIDRIEILRGPQALRYTARAAGGVINIITRMPPEDGPAAEAMIANGDQQNVRGDLIGAWGTPTLGGSLVYRYTQIGGFETPHPDSQDLDDGLPTTFGEGSLYRTHDLYGTVSARPVDALELTTRLGYRIRDDGYAIDDEPITSRRENQRLLFSQDGRLALGTATSLRGTLTHSTDRVDTSVGRIFRLDDSYTRLQLSGERFFEIGPTTHLLSVGADLSTYSIELEDGPIDPSIAVPQSELQERIDRGGLFAILESEFTRWLSSEIGIRREMHSRFFPAWLPQAAVLVTPWRWDAERALKLRLSAGRAVRYPSLREIFQPPSPQLGGGYFLAGSRDLSPEKAWALRASVEANPVRWLSVAVTGFYSRTHDFIRASDRGQSIQVGETPIPANPVLCPVDPIWCSDRVEPVLSTVYQSTNLDDLRSYGIEARVDLRPTESVGLQLGYTWNRSLVTDSNLSLGDDRLPNSPEHIANGALTLTAPRLATTLTARGQWRDRAVIERSGTGLAGFASGEESNTSFTLDLRLRQPFDVWLGRSVEVFADVLNVTDNRVIDSYVVRGRSFLIGLRGRFP